MQRRALLACAGISVSALAGCTDWTGDPEDDEDSGEPTDPDPEDDEESDEPIDPEELEGYIRPDRDPETVPAELSCEKEEFERQSGVSRPAVYGDGEKFSMRVNDLAFEDGDQMTIQMTNITGETASTGTRHDYNFELYTEAGWQEVRGWADGQPVGIPDDQESHEPGNGYRWLMEFTEEGITHLGETHIVCPDLQSGCYRFVYIELSDRLAVAFDLQRDT